MQKYKPLALITEDLHDPYLIKIIDYMRGLGFEIVPETSEHYLQDISSLLPMVVFRTDPSGKITYVNALCEKITGYSKQEMLGRFWNDLIQPVSIPPFHVDETSGSAAQFIDKNGKRKTIFIAISPLRNHDDENEPNGYCAAFFNITQYVDLNSNLSEVDRLDPLTQLINRVAFVQEIEKSVLRAKRRHSKNALIKIDIDSFSSINEMYGITTGDEYLKSVAAKLCTIARETDSIARMGEDEFALLLDEISDSHSISMVTARVNEMLQKAIQIGEHEIKSTACMGISIFPDLALSADALVRTAHRALAIAKSIGPGTIQFDSEAINSSILRNSGILGEFDNAFKMNEFYLVFQPQINLNSGKFSGYEALLRWNNLKLGEILPGEFIPIAEDTTFINLIGQWVYEQAIMYHARWMKAYPDAMKEVKVSINLSAHQLHDEKLIEWLTHNLIKHNLSAHQVVLEVTETGLANDLANKIKIINQLRGIGFDISLDDFGTGYSSMSILQKIAFTQLKIDQSFIKTMFQSKKSEAIVKAIIGLSKIPGIKVVAEGVEDDLSLKYLKDNNCDLGQGFYLSKPLTSEDMELYIKNYR